MTGPGKPPVDDGFLSRWSRRKAQTRDEPPVVESTPETPALDADRPPAGERAAAGEAPLPPGPVDQTVPAPPPPPTLEDVKQLTLDADFSGFVRPGVDREVRNAALKKLFTDPHYNVMDGLDIYIDDYGRPDPIPESMLRKMTQSKFLGLFSDEADPATDPTDPAAPVRALPGAPHEIPEPDEDPDLRLQPDDAAASDGPDPGPGEDPGRER